MQIGGMGVGGGWEHQGVSIYVRLLGSITATKVLVRVRPFLPKEAQRGEALSVRGQQCVLKVPITQLFGPPKLEEKIFQFDGCYDRRHKNEVLAFFLYMNNMGSYN